MTGSLIAHCCEHYRRFAILVALQKYLSGRPDMKRDFDTLPLPIAKELIIDNFAGGGGASTALSIALGREPDVAINHDGEALCMHAANHPTTQHYTEDVFLIHPGFITRQQPIGVIWFSPTCTHFSKAKGGNILNQKVRGLAWVTVKWAVMQVPRMIYLENVEEFQSWGPLDDAGRPIKEFKGRTFDAFVKAMTTGLPKNHPDIKEIHDILGADFPIYRLHAGLGYKVEWKVLKACDFGAPTIRKRLFMVMRRDGRPIIWPAATHGDRNSTLVKVGRLLPYRSAADCIDWSIPCPSIFGRKKPLKPATLCRVGKGYERYVKDATNPYIVGQGDPTYVGAHITKFNTGSVGHGADEPLATITSGGRSKRPAGSPHGLGLVAASLVQYYSGGGQNVAAEAPMPTIVTKDRIGVTCAYLAKHYKGIVGASVEAPMPTVTTVDHTSVITAHLAGVEATSNAGIPINSIPTENRHVVVAAHIQRDMGQSVGHAADTPLATVTAGGGGKSALVTSNMVRLRGTSSAADSSDPLGTITAGGLHHAEIRTTLATNAESEAKRQVVREFLWEYCASLKNVERPELVTIHGVVMEVVDIGLRMLSPRELATAQGFPEDYILDPLYTSVNKRGKTVTKPLSKSAQVRMIGNSVSPPPAIALIRANCTHELELEIAIGRAA